MRVAIVGAGVAGLSAALSLQADHEVVVFEAEGAPGGKMRSEHRDGYLFEWGPNGFLSDAKEMRALCDDLGIADELVEANAAAAKRYIYWGGKLHALPQKPPQALTTALLSPLGKARALRELFYKPDASVRDRETVQDFFVRHFGIEVAERIVAPALLGMSAGDACETSVDAAFPKLREMEREYGSMLRAAMRNRPAERSKLLSFGAAGMQRFADAARGRLGDRLRLTAPVERIDRDDASWRVSATGETERFDAVIATAPAYAAASMVRAFDSKLSALLGHIAFAPMRVLGLAFRAKDVPVPLDGFGFLAARRQGVRILGALYTSTMYPEQAPPDTAYMRVFMGGAADPEVMALDEDAACQVALHDLRTTLGITAEPIAHHKVLWPKAIPQYGRDHVALVAQIDAHVKRHRRLVIAGNSYRGLGVGDTVREAVARAQIGVA